MPANYAPGSAPTPKAPAVKLPPAPHDSGPINIGRGGRVVAAPVYHAPAPQRVVLPNPHHQQFKAPAPQRVVQPNPDHQQFKAPAPKVAAIERLGAGKAQQLVSRAQQESAPVRLPTPQSADGGGGPTLGAITAARVGGIGGAIDPVGGFIGNALKDTLNLPINIAKSVSTVYGAAAKSGDIIAHGGDPLQSLAPIGQTAVDMVKGWEPVRLAQDAAQHGLGHAVGTLGSDLYNAPLSTGMQLLPIPGAVARGVAAGARASGLADAAGTSLARATPTVSGGLVPLTHSDRWSPNPIMRAVQRKVAGSPALTDLRNQAKGLGNATWTQGKEALAAARASSPGVKLANARDTMRVAPALNAINKRYDWFHSGVLTRARGAVRDLTSQDSPLGGGIHDAAHLLKGDAVASNNIGHVLTGDITQNNPVQAMAQLRNLHASVSDALAKHDAGVATMTTDEARQAGITQQHLASLINSPNFETHLNTMFAAAHALAPSIRGVGAAQLGEGIFTKDQLDRRALMHYALQNMPGVKVAGPEDLTAGALDHINATKAETQAAANVTSAGTEAARWAGLRGRGPILTPEDRFAAVAAGKATAAEYALKTKLADVQKAKLDPASAAGQTAEARISALRDKAVTLRQGASDLAAHAHQVRIEGKASAYQDLSAAHDAQREATQYRQGLDNQGIKPTDHHNGLITPNEAYHPLNSLTAPMRPLETHEMAAHAVLHGHPDLAYVNETVPTEAQLGVQEAARGQGRGGAPQDSHVYTGAGVHTGTWDASLQGILGGLHDSMWRTQRVRNLNDLIKTFKTHEGRTPEQAAQIIKDVQREHGLTLTPVHEHPQGISQEQAQVLHANQHSSPDLTDEAHTTAQMENRVADLRNMDPNARVSLVPQQALNRQTAHLKVDALNNVFTTSNRMFRNAVLPTSTKWLMANTSEVGLRNLIHGIGPDYRSVADRVLDPTTLGRGNAAAGYNIANDFRSMVGDTGTRNFGQHVQDLMDNPDRGPSALARAWTSHTPFNQTPWTAYRQGAYKTVRGIEHRGEDAVLGKHFATQIQDLQRGMTTSGKTMDEYVKMVQDGVRGPQAQELAFKAARQINDVLGKYQGYSPAARAFIKTSAPFLPWYLNSIKFIYHTMPAHHPLLTGAAIAGAHAYYKDGNPDALGLVAKFANAEIGGVQYGDLLSAAKTGPNAYWNPARYMPTGAFTQGPLNTILGTVLPQVQPAVNAFEGRDPYNKPLKDAHGNTIAPFTTPALVSGIESALGTYLNPLNIANRVVMGQGRTEAATGFGFKPNSSAGAPSLLKGLNRVLNPFYSTVLRPHAASAPASGPAYNNNAPPKAIVPSGNGLANYNNSSPKAVGSIAGRMTNASLQVGAGEGQLPADQINRLIRELDLAHKTKPLGWVQSGGPDRATRID